MEGIRLLEWFNCDLKYKQTFYFKHCLLPKNGTTTLDLIKRRYHRPSSFVKCVLPFLLLIISNWKRETIRKWFKMTNSPESLTLNCAESAYVLYQPYPRFLSVVYFRSVIPWNICPLCKHTCHPLYLYFPTATTITYRLLRCSWPSPLTLINFC